MRRGIGGSLLGYERKKVVEESSSEELEPEPRVTRASRGISKTSARVSPPPAKAQAQAQVQARARKRKR